MKVLLVSILFTPCTPLLPSPFHRSHNVSVPHCFVLPSLLPLLSHAPLAVRCVLALIRALTVHKKIENIKKFHLNLFNRFKEEEF